HDDDVAVVSGGVDGPTDAESAGDLVAHAGERVLDVIAERVTGPPELLQIPGQGPGGLDDDVAGAGGPVDGSDDLGLTGQLSIGVGSGGVDLGGPVRLLGLDPAAVVRLDPEPAEAGGQSLQSRPGVGDRKSVV